MKTRWSFLGLLFVMVVIAIPFALINSGFSMIGTSTDETLHTLLRLSALLGISLIFLQVVSGAFRPALVRAFNPRVLFITHRAFGILGFSFIVAHFVFLIPSIGEHWANLNHGFFVLGPLMLAVLVLTVSTALLFRRRLPRTWNTLHILNYAALTVAVVHALGIGTQASLLATKIVLVAYVLVDLAGFAYRARSPQWRRRVLSSGARTRSGRDR